MNTQTTVHCPLHTSLRANACWVVAVVGLLVFGTIFLRTECCVAQVQAASPIQTLSVRNIRACPPPLRIDSARDETLLNPAAAMVIDSSQALTIQDIDHITERLRPIPGGIVNFGVSEFPFWFCVTLANPDSIPLQRLLCAEDYFLEVVDTYIYSRHGAMQHQMGGCSIPFSQKIVKNRFTVQPLVIPAHDTLYVFVRVLCRLTMNVPLLPWQTAVTKYQCGSTLA
jgi:hypothetical protein